MKKLFFAALLASLVIACGPSTEITKSWKDPGASVNLDSVNKILVIGLVKDETARRVVEDNLVTRLKGKGVPSYSYLTGEMTSATNDALAAKLKADGFDYVLIMRLADVEKETSYVPGTTSGYYGSYYGYYSYGMGAYSSPGYYTTDKNYFIETMVYSVPEDKLLWSSTTKTVNPSKLESSLNEIGSVISAKMRKEGFLK
jgi:hypothetical protein